SCAALRCDGGEIEPPRRRDEPRGVNRDAPAQLVELALALGRRLGGKRIEQPLGEARRLARDEVAKQRRRRAACRDVASMPGAGADEDELARQIEVVAAGQGGGHGATAPLPFVRSRKPGMSSGWGAAAGAPGGGISLPHVIQPSRDLRPNSSRYGPPK